MVANGYTADIGRLDNQSWSDLLLDFEDASIYQSWAYGAARWGERNLRHVVLRKEGRVVGVAQVCLRQIPFLKIGVAYVGWGPVWKPRKSGGEAQHFSTMVRLLKAEFATSRGLHLRLFPNQFGNQPESHQMLHIMRNEGFEWQARPLRTLLLDLSQSLEGLRSNLRRKWRQALGYAEKKNLDIISGTDLRFLESALSLYREMHERKGFAEFADIEKLPVIQKLLSPSLKMTTMICTVEGEPVAALTWTSIGNTGFPMLAATGLKGRDTFASYLLWWKMVATLKDEGCLFLDLGGINPERNPGGHIFKSGLAGKSGKDVEYIGQFGFCDNSVNRAFMKGADRLLAAYERARLYLEKKAQMRASNSGARANIGQTAGPQGVKPE